MTSSSLLAMDTTLQQRPDERAAGVISGADPYRELELYLEKVNEEIGEVFERWRDRQHRKKPSTKPSPKPPTPPPPPPARPVDQDLAWFAEFNTLIARELQQLGRHERDALMRLRLPRSRSWDRDRKRTSVARQDSGAVLVRVASLPDSDLLSDLEHDRRSPSPLAALEDGDPDYSDDGCGPTQDAGTQTSPAASLSPSSSFTWVSSDYLDMDSSSSSSASSSSPSSCSSCSDSLPSDDLDEEPESGIGTASPPRHKAAASNAGGAKVRRKETWERIRRRHSSRGRQQQEEEEEVWVRRPCCLPLPPPQNQQQQEQQQAQPTTSLQLPSPADLGNKSSSAPVLVKQASNTPSANANTSRIQAQPRSHSERHLAEIEAAEACKWLRAAGFPQYAQMYEDLQFPIDVSGVQKDHPFLEPDSLQSLFRRLHALNRCAKMKVDNMPKNDADDSDDDNICALSENWTFQPESRRWSRVCELTAEHAERLQALSGSVEGLSPEEEEDEVPVIASLRYGSLPPGHPDGDTELLAARFRRTGSERLRDSAKALLRRMESLKSSRRRRRQNNREISSPQVVDVSSMQQRMRELNCVDVSPEQQQPPSPTSGGGSGFGDDSSDGSQGGTTPPNHRARPKLTRTKKLFHHGGEEHGALSDSECQPTSWRHQYLRDANSNHTKVMEFMDGRSRGVQDQEQARQTSVSGKSQGRTGSLNLGKDSQRYREKIQGELSKDVTVYRSKSGSSELTGSQDSSSTLASQAESDHDDTSDATPRHKGTVVRWHSFQRGSARPDSYLFRASTESTVKGSRPLSALSCGQLLVLRKLSLLKLTACMERYCPTHRTGWNWELPKFIRKIKTPDYKDKTVFGVPLLLSLQRNGQALPKSIQAALRWLRLTSLDQVGLFRKSGVRSRIQKLKTMTETQGDAISFEGQQAYDVADMVKQYFRELPEALLTNKLSETFIAIFQHVPMNLRAEAVQCVLLLLPDEHREALQTLLDFLSQVAAKSACNQMTASNLAVCLAPSLFHFHHAPSSTSSSPSSRSSSASPRRRKTVGIPDQRELSENKAAHDCLLYLIKEHKNLFMVSEELLAQCHFNYMEESVPVALEELGAEFQQDWRGYLYACTTALLKEAREKSRGWVSMACTADQQVEMAYKKVGDGHPLRLWRVSTEVEAPPQELLQRVLRERHIWDYNLLKWRTVARLDSQVEVFQYVCANMAPLPAKDYCVLRSWRTDLPKGSCVIVETSVEHPDGPVMLGGVRGIVLASRYLIEPCGSGKSRIMHLSRVDTKGRTPEWYNKSYGHICALYLTRIRSSFKHNTEGPESKV